MRIGLVSDCEGDVVELDAALKTIRRYAPDVIVHAGDILHCHGSPNPPGETIALLRAEQVQAIPGNHDRYLIDWGTARWPHTLWMRLRRSDPAGGWLERIAAVQAEIPPDDLTWLRSLPEEMMVTDGVWVCHGMPGNPWNTIWPRHPVYDANVSDIDREASLRMLADHGADVVLCGHVPEPREYLDRLPDGRKLRVVRAGWPGPGQVGVAILTADKPGWDVEWLDIEVKQSQRTAH